MEVGAERTEGEERGAYVDVEPRCFFEDAIQAARFCDGAGGAWREPPRAPR